MSNTIGLEKAIQVFEKAKNQVPAYQEILKEHNLESFSCDTEADFKHLPIIDKKSYVKRFDFARRLKTEEMPPIASASSGSSGVPTFWFRDENFERAGGELHSQIFQDSLDLDPKKSTLVVVSFSMGMWVAGGYTLSSCRHMAKNGWNLTTITPGIEESDILYIFQKLAPLYDQVVLAGYPPFVINIVHKLRDNHISIPKTFKFITAGDKFSEEWRKDLTHLSESADITRTVSNIYGSADAGVLGFETPISTKIRQKTTENETLFDKIFGETFGTPALVQYNPNYIYFEEHENELTLTADNIAPLVRYNIHDRGNVFSANEMKELLKSQKLEPKNYFSTSAFNDMPFVAIKGRTDVAVSFFAFNIPAEHLQAGLSDERISDVLTGNFLAYSRDEQQGRYHKLYIELELKPDVTPSEEIKNKAQEAITSHLRRLHTEYRKTYSSIGKQALPNIILRENGHKNFKKGEAKGLLNQNGKKPKVQL